MTGREESWAPRASFVAYLAIAGLISLAIWILLPIPNFLALRGWSSQRTGWAVGTYFIASLIAQIVAGYIADRFGNIRTAVWGAGVGCVAGLTYLGAFWLADLMFPARVLHAVAASLISGGALIELVGSVPVEVRGRMMGYFGLPGFVMLGGGPVLSEWFVYRWGFLACLGAVLVIFVMIRLILMTLPASIASGHGTVREPFRKAFRDSFPALRPVLAYSVVVGLCFASWQAFLAPAVKSLGGGAISKFGFGYAAGAVATRLGLSHHLDTGAKRLAGIATMVAFSAALAAIPQVGQARYLIGLGLVCGMSHGIYYPSLSSLAAERFHPVHGGQAMSLYFSASSLGMFVGPPIWGALADVAGYRVVFAVAAAVLAAATGGFVYYEWRQHRRAAAALELLGSDRL
jgi:MFS family permease